MAKWILVDETGELTEGSSVTLPNAGVVKVGGSIKGSTSDLQAELDQFYPGRFLLQVQQG